MKKIFCLFAIILMFSSCEYNNGWLKPERVDLDLDGISTVDIKGELVAEIPASGAKFSMKGKGRNTNCAFVTDIEINGIPDREVLNEDSYIIREWGELKNTKDYKIFISINPNNSSEVKEFKLLIGFGYWTTHIRIKQPPVKTE